MAKATGSHRRRPWWQGRHGGIHTDHGQGGKGGRITCTAKVAMGAKITPSPATAARARRITSSTATARTAPDHTEHGSGTLRTARVTPSTATVARVARAASCTARKLRSPPLTSNRRRNGGGSLVSLPARRKRPGFSRRRDWRSKGGKEHEHGDDVHDLEQGRPGAARQRGGPGGRRAEPRATDDDVGGARQPATATTVCTTRARAARSSTSTATPLATWARAARSSTSTSAPACTGGTGWSGDVWGPQ